MAATQLWPGRIPFFAKLFDLMDLAENFADELAEHFISVLLIMVGQGRFTIEGGRDCHEGPLLIGAGNQPVPYVR